MEFSGMEQYLAEVSTYHVLFAATRSHSRAVKVEHAYIPSMPPPHRNTYAPQQPNLQSVPSGGGQAGVNINAYGVTIVASDTRQFQYPPAANHPVLPADSAVTTAHTSYLRRAIERVRKLAMSVSLAGSGTFMRGLGSVL